MYADNTPEYTLQSGGIERTYRLHIPEQMPEQGPLVIVLHGYGNPRPGVLNETADRYRFTVCYPQGEKDSRGKACWSVGYPFQQDMTVPLFEIHGTNDKTSAWEGDLHNSGGWGEYLPVTLAVHYCAAKNRCTTMHTDTIIGKAPHHRQIVRHRFTEGLNSSEVWLYEVRGGGHSWFWDDMETGDELWRLCRFIKYDL